MTYRYWEYEFLEYPIIAFPRDSRARKRRLLQNQRGRPHHAGFEGISLSRDYNREDLDTVFGLDAVPSGCVRVLPLLKLA